MAKAKKPTQSTSPKKPVQETQKQQEDRRFLYDKRNYILFALGAVMIILGFFLMRGGGSDDPNVFNPNVFSTTRITIAPILVIGGFVVNIFAIMLKPKQ